MKRYSIPVLLFALVLSGAVQAQQKPSAADKVAAEKAAQDELTKRAAELAAAEAEAAARARQKVAEETARAQMAKVEELDRQAREIVPLDLEVVISRYDGDKKLSSLPYALTINASRTNRVNDAALTSLRMGGQVPLPMMSTPVGPDGKPMAGFTPAGPVQYHDIGTNIDARGRILGDGRFEIWVQVADDSISMPQGGPSSSTLPVIRSFRTANNIVLRDGQTRQFTAAADRITGEVVKVDLTLKIAK